MFTHRNPQPTTCASITQTITSPLHASRTRAWQVPGTAGSDQVAARRCDAHTFPLTITRFSCCIVCPLEANLQITTIMIADMLRSAANLTQHKNSPLIKKPHNLSEHRTLCVQAATASADMVINHKRPTGQPKQPRTTHYAQQQALYQQPAVHCNQSATQ